MGRLNNLINAFGNLDKEDNWGYCSDIYRVCCKRFDGMGHDSRHVQVTGMDLRGSAECGVRRQRLFSIVQYIFNRNDDYTEEFGGATRGLDIKAKRK